MQGIGLFQPELQQMQKGEDTNMVTKTMVLSPDQKPSKEQLHEVQKAAQKPIVFDEDSPELSPAMLKQLKVAARNRDRILQNIKQN